MIAGWQLLAFGSLFFIIPIIALIDILKNRFEGNNKLIWTLVVLFTSIIGSILYFLIGRKYKIDSPKT
nr:PLDc N-terminal domain-containing protein [Mesonia sp.]